MNTNEGSKMNVVQANTSLIQQEITNYRVSKKTMPSNDYLYQACIKDEGFYQGLKQVEEFKTVEEAYTFCLQIPT